MFVSGADFSLVCLAIAFGAFLFLAPNILNTVLLCEIVWIGIYFYGISVGGVSDSLAILVWSVLVLCLATGESVVGLSLLMFKFALEGTIRKIYGQIEGRRTVGKGYSRFWNK